MALCAPGPTFLGSKDSSPFRIRSPCSLVSGCEITIKECQCEKDHKNVIIHKECRAPCVGPSLGSPTNVSKVRMGAIRFGQAKQGTDYVPSRILFALHGHKNKRVIFSFRRHSPVVKDWRTYQQLSL